jgi:hypothetical protein
MVNGRGARRSAVLVGLQDSIRPFLTYFSVSIFLQDFGKVLMVAANVHDSHLRLADRLYACLATIS